jgi:hypothetical protein
MKKLILAFVFLSGLTGAARADEKADKKPADKAAPAEAAPAEMPWEKACEADLKKFCSGPEVKKDDDGLKGCLADNEKKLSKDCTKHFSAAGYRVLKYCEKDISRLCEKEASENKLPQCMQAKADKLSPKCREALTPPKPAEPESAAATANTPKKKGKKK